MTSGRVWQARRRGAARRHAEAAAFKRRLADLSALLRQPVLAVDPSIGSSASMPGWAVGAGGVIQASGVIHIDPKAPSPERLETLTLEIQALVCQWSIKLGVLEYIRHKKMPAQLFWACGAAQAGFGYVPVLELPVSQWKTTMRTEDVSKFFGPEGYTKTDENDARMLLACLYTQEEFAHAY